MTIKPRPRALVAGQILELMVAGEIDRGTTYRVLRSLGLMGTTRGQVKNLLVDAACHGVLPFWVVQLAFRILRLANV